MSIKKLIYIWTICSLSISGMAQSPNTDQLKSEIQRLFKSTSGEFAIAFRNLARENDQLLINERKVFHAASTMKTPVMIEVYKQVTNGRFSLNDSITVKNEFKSIVDGSTFTLDINDDSGEQLYQYIGQKRSVRDLVVDMIIYSSNLATNLIIELVDAKNVNRTMRNMGAMDIDVLRGVEDIKAYNAGLSNTTTAYDLLLIFEQLALGKAVDPDASQQMINILRQQTHRDIIPAKLPETVRVANKTGSITGIHHDSGIVELPDGRQYVLILLSKKMKDFDAGTHMLAEVSKMVYDYMMVNAGDMAESLTD